MHIRHLVVPGGVTELKKGALGGYFNHQDGPRRCVPRMVTIPPSVTTISEDVLAGPPGELIPWIRGIPGSAAEAFAAAHQIPFLDRLREIPAADLEIMAQYRYTITDEGVTIDKYFDSPDTPSRLVVPETIEGRPVVAIGKKAFQWAGMTGICLPKTLRYIGDHAFENCNRLMEIEGLEYVTDIGERILDYGYLHCHDEVIVAARLLWAAAKDSVYTVPETVREIDTRAINEVSDRIKKIVISKNVREIGDAAFCGCRGLERFEVDPENEHFCAVDGILYPKDRKKLLLVPDRYERRELILPEGLEEIKASAFAKDDIEIEHVVIPKTVKQVGKDAFKGCYNFTIYDTAGTWVRDMGVCSAVHGETVTVRSAETGEVKFTVYYNRPDQMNINDLWGPNGTFDFAAYDKLLLEHTGDLEPETVRLRLTERYALSREAEQGYRAWVAEYPEILQDAIRACIAWEDIAEFRSWVEIGAVHPGNIDQFAEYAREHHSAKHGDKNQLKTMAFVRQLCRICRELNGEKK